MLKPLPITTLYIFLFVATIILPVTYFLSNLFLNASLDKNGHGIDGVGAAIFAAIIFKFMIYISYVIYVIFMIKIIQSVLFYKEVPNFLMAIPLLPIIIAVILNLYFDYELKNKQKTYSIDEYVTEVKGFKAQNTYDVDGTNAVYAQSYISSFVANDNYWLSTRLMYNKAKRKELIDKSIPILMKDIENDNICYCKFYDGKDHYFKTSIEKWEYKKEKDVLIIKFEHLDKPCVYEIKYFDIAGTH